MQMLSYCRDLHTAQQERGGRSHHEQSASSHAPFDSDEWPWAISKPPVSVKVAGCAVDLTDHKGEKLLAKEWRIESSSFPLLASLEPYKCPGGHEHGESHGSGRYVADREISAILGTARRIGVADGVRRHHGTSVWVECGKRCWLLKNAVWTTAA